MDFGFSPKEEILIREVRDFIRQEATPELLAETLGLGMIYGGKGGGLEPGPGSQGESPGQGGPRRGGS